MILIILKLLKKIAGKYYLVLVNTNEVSGMGE